MIHPSHVMRDTQDGKVCGECDRCTCHRPSHLEYICPAVEYEGNELDD